MFRHLKNVVIFLFLSFIVTPQQASSMQNDIERLKVVSPHCPLKSALDEETPPTISFSEGSKLFVESLLEPFIGEDAQEFYARQVSQAKVKGIARYIWGNLKELTTTLTKHKLETVCLVGGAALGFTNLAEYVPSAPLFVNAAYNIRTGQSLARLAQGIEGDKLLKKVYKATLLGGAVLAVSYIPAAAALEWNNLKAAQNYYGGDECPSDPWNKLINPVIKCLNEGGTLDSCKSVISEKPETDLYDFARHYSLNEETNPVSITKLHKQETCFYTALNPGAPVTKTCFKDLSAPDTRTVELATDMTLTQAHEGLDPGKSVLHVGMHYESQHCGFFKKLTINSDLGKDPTCLLTALEPGGEVSQLCFNPDNPTSLTLKKVAGFSLSFLPDGKPVSIVIKNPEKLGLNIEPEIPCSPQTKTGFSLWDALGWWWRQETPCSKTTTKDHDEL